MRRPLPCVGCCSLLPAVLRLVASRCCRIIFHAGSPAERQLFRTDFRFAPSPRRASLAVPPIHGTWASTVCAEEFPTPLEMSLHGLNLLRHSKSFSPSAPIAYATSVSPPNEAAAWPGRMCWVPDEAAASQGRRCWVANDAADCP